jgi:putative transposase
MKDNRLRYTIKCMSRVLKVSRSGYYAWQTREPSIRAQDDKDLSDLIRGIHQRSRETYGSRRIQAELAAQGWPVGRDHISRLRLEMGLRCIQRRKFRATTYSNHNLPTAPNLLNQEFYGLLPGQVWGVDITYITTGEGWLYLAGVKDFGSKEIVGRAVGERMTKELVRIALKKALAFRKPESGCIHHSDHGSQFCSYEYRRDVEAAGFRVSMSRKGNCYDNAPTESFWGCLKLELVYQRTFATRAEATAALRNYIEIFYNRVRRHSSIGNVAPSIYAESF